MERVALTVPRRAQVKDLLSPELEVPRHQPDLHLSQPCPSPSIDAGYFSNEAQLDSTRISTSEVVPVDSAQESVLLDDSQTQAQPSQASPSIVPRDNLENQAEPMTAQSVGTAQVQDQVQQGGAQREDRSEAMAGPATTGELTLPGDAIIDIGEEEVSTERPRRPDTRSPILGSRQFCMKLFFWIRNKSSRDKQSSKNKADTTAPQRLGVIATPREQTASDVLTATATDPNSNTAVDLEPPAYAVAISADSPHLYRLEDGTYMGKLEDLSPPATLEITWSSKTRKRLITDLQPILTSLPRSLSRDERIIELELCMSGRADTSNRAQLSPSIWIRCGSKRCRDEIRKAVADLSYLRVFQVHVRLDAPRFACRSMRCPSIVARQVTENPQANSSGDFNSAAIAGVVLAGLFSTILLIVVVLFACRGYPWRRKMKRTTSFVSPLTGVPNDPAEVHGSGHKSSKLYPIKQQELQLMTEHRGRDSIWNSYGQNPSNPSPLWPDSLRSSSRAFPPGPSSSTVLGSSEGSYTEALVALGANRPGYSGGFNTTPTHVKEHTIFEEGTQAATSACGLKIEFEVWDGGVRCVATSTIGGLIRLNGVTYGLTTAHSIFELLPTYDRSQRYGDTNQDRYVDALNVRIGKFNQDMRTDMTDSY
jgi:hypothetical protein